MQRDDFTSLFKLVVAFARPGSDLTTMKLILTILILLIALQHLAFLWLEMFAWTTTGKKVFRSLKPDLFEPTKVLAANQGLYNGFLAAGLIWSVLISDPVWSANVALFFLSCVFIAGLYGGWSASRRIFWIQGLPALITIGVLMMG